MKKKLLLLFLSFTSNFILAQEVPIKDGWKFIAGDNLEQYRQINLDEGNWKDVNVSNSWDQYGYENYIGFGWYRKHVTISSSIMANSYLKDSVRISLGTLDDGDEVYLNGKLIGRNGNEPGTDIKKGSYGPRTYTIAANNPAIKWNADNVLAVRVFNNSGPGGMSGRNFFIKVPTVAESIVLNTNYDFKKNTAGNFITQVELKTKKVSESVNGALQIVISDPELNKVLKSETISAHFESGKPFLYTVNFSKLDQKKSYTLKYRFTEVKSGEEVMASLNTPYILTPLAKQTPRINSADIYGARPGNEFHYKIPATGIRPMTYQAKGLPQGLRLNSATGIINGKTGLKGTYEIELIASNKLGTAKKKLTLKIGDQIGLTPALGWNSWNAWGLSVSDEKVKISAREMADKLMDHGWSYINIDDGWEAPKRAANGEILTNGKFPDMKGLSDYVHGLGLKIGIYSSPGDETCGGYLGSLDHELQDAQTYAKWNIDYLKYDWCGYRKVAGNSPTLEVMKKPYLDMRQALDKTGRDILYSLCQYGMGDVYKWGKEVGGNSWRTTGDITDTWASMSRIGFGQAKCYPYSQPDGFIDPDMLIVGKVGWGPMLHNTRLTPDEQYTHISLWSLLSSPLLIGCDMGQLDEFTLGLLTNDEVIAIDQDAQGKQAKQVLATNEYQVWVKDLQDGGKAIGIFNLTENYKNIEIKWKDLGISGYQTIRDVWTQKDINRFGEGISSKIPSHGVKLFKVIQ